MENKKQIDPDQEITFVCNDDKEIKIPWKHAQYCKTLKAMLLADIEFDDDGSEAYTIEFTKRKHDDGYSSIAFEYVKKYLKWYDEYKNEEDQKKIPEFDVPKEHGIEVALLAGFLRMENENDDDLSSDEEEEEEEEEDEN